jgi:hypothetical protein
MTTYYKVVRQDGKRLVSVVMGDGGWCRKLQRTYSTDGWTHGVNGTPVLAFANRGEAKDFAECYSGQAWLAQVKRPRRLTVLVDVNDGVRYLLAFWKQIAGKRWFALETRANHVEAPEYTVACEAIRLVKRA